MARVTVEDCIKKVSNRFELVLLSSQRARQISAGASLTLERDNDKNPVVALREIAAGSVSTEDLEKGLIETLQKHSLSDEPEEEYLELLADEQSFAGALQQETEVAELALDAEIAEVEQDVDLDVSETEDTEEEDTREEE